MRYIPHTEGDIAHMLKVIGASSIEELFSDIPKPLRLKGELNLPPALTEGELFRHLAELGATNKPAGQNGILVFAGAGCCSHAIPSTVDHLSGRSEFYTAYTPYQPELSQGTLLAIFEFQTLVCDLMQMEYANASMYDGASATAEGILMAQRLTDRKKVFLFASLHPEYAQTVKTYLSGMSDEGIDIHTLPMTSSGQADLQALKEGLDENTAAVVVQSPNFFGVLEDLAPICEMAHQHGALAVSVSTEPLVYALMQPPGSIGVDIAVAEGIGFAGPPNLGGPGLGMFAANGKKALRAMPGRIVGQTVDTKGQVGYVLTLSTREQHIRREKATSNICTNHGLMALRFMIHLALLGKSGFKQLAQLNLSKAVYAKERLTAIKGVSLKYEAPFFNEFTLRINSVDAQDLVAKAARQGVVPGVSLSRFFSDQKDSLLVAINETHRKEDIDRLAETLKSVM